MSLPTTIKALQIQADSTTKVVEIPFAEQEKVKNIPPNDVIIRVRAVGINPTDWKHAQVDMWGEPNTISGCDAAGDVVKVGSNVSHAKVGDRVFGFAYGGIYKDNGAFAEYVRVSANSVSVIPDGMSYAEAAGFPIPHLTAAMYFYLRLGIPYPSSSPSSAEKKQNFLVWGGSSAVGHHVIQLAKIAGFRVITTASAKNHEFLKSVGADVTIDYKDPDVAAKLKDAVKDGGLKYAIDAISEHGSTDIILDTITEEGGHVVTTLPVEPKFPAHHPNTKVEFALAYEIIMDGPFKFAKVVPIEPKKEDQDNMRKYLSTELPKVLEGWVEGKGNAQFKGQKLNVGHGLDKVPEGLKYMKEGKVSAEKLVYLI